VACCIGAHRNLRGAFREAGEQAGAVLLAHVEQRSAELEVDGGGDRWCGRFGQGTLEQSRGGLQGPEAPGGLGGATQRCHDSGVAARGGVHEVLGHALIIDTVLSE
jgi:hypothetical protein